MGLRASLMLVPLSMAACTVPPEGIGAFRIWDFEQGLIADVAAGTPRVYKAGNELVYATNGTCAVNREWRPCMWYGVAFSYASPTGAAVLECVAEFDSPTKLANPTMMAERAVASSKWRMRLDGRHGRKVHAQYMVGHAERMAVSHVKHTCRHEGREVLSFEFTVRPAGR